MYTNRYILYVQLTMLYIYYIYIKVQISLKNKVTVARSCVEVGAITRLAVVNSYSCNMSAVRLL